MALSKITYNDKVALNPQPSIANENKCTDSDLNQIKSVVNNAIDNLETIQTYSTTESVIGIWTNGKPIYRKMWSGTINDTQIQFDSITNKGITVAVGGTFTSPSGYTNSIPFHSGDTAYCRLVVNEANGRPILTIPTAMEGGTYTFYVEYTKTID